MKIENIFIDFYRFHRFNYIKPISYLDDIIYGDQDLEYISYSLIWILRSSNALEIRLIETDKKLYGIEIIKRLINC